LDNLNLHRGDIVSKKAYRLNIEIVFNATYSSNYNPVERLWLFSKKIWRRKMFDYKNYSNRTRMYQFVESSIKEANQKHLEFHV